MNDLLRQSAIAVVSVFLLFGCAGSDDPEVNSTPSDTSMESTSAAMPAVDRMADAAGSLDGKRFVVDGGEQGRESDSRDTLSFMNGMIHSKGCDQWGFGEGAYRAVTNAPATTFEATTTSEKEGRIEWKGSVSGETIEGTYRWVKEGQNPIDYWFKGTMM